jgi:transcriptional regulator with XRE-family HTH domain
MKELTDEEKKLVSQLGKRIKMLRLEKGYTNYEHFANEQGISRTQYGRYEVGDNVKILTLKKIIDGLGISLKEFFSEGFDN